MKRIIQHTGDGSQTIAVPDLHVTYHSVYGAIQESRHVYIKAGLQPLLNTKEPLYIFEMGFGTGLNGLLTLQQAIKSNQKIYYFAVELFPLEEEMYSRLDYSKLLKNESLQQYFLKMHTCSWQEEVAIHPLFTLYKSKISITSFSTDQHFNLVYYDAFDPAAQPELWTQEIFEKLYKMMQPKSFLVTYCSKGIVRRAMQAAGFSVEKLQGPPGKKEIVRAVKN